MAKKSNKKAHKKFGIKEIFFALLLIVISFYAILFLSGFGDAKQEETDIDELDEENRIKIVVFNGCQDSKKTLQITDLIRKNAYIDVIDIIKSPGSTYPSTMLLDRKGDDEKMLKLAKMLGLNNNDIIKQRSDQYIDATLVIGIDHEVLWKTLNKKWN